MSHYARVSVVRGVLRAERTDGILVYVGEYTVTFIPQGEGGLVVGINRNTPGGPEAIAQGDVSPSEAGRLCDALGAMLDGE